MESIARENTFFPPKHSWALNYSNRRDMFTFERKKFHNYCTEILSWHPSLPWETQHLKDAGAALVRGRCCHIDELWLVGKQVQERSLQITLSLVLRKTKAASGISKKKKKSPPPKDGKVVRGKVGRWGRGKLLNAFISILWTTIAYQSTSVKSGEMVFDTNVSSESARCTSPCQHYS